MEMKDGSSAAVFELETDLEVTDTEEAEFKRLNVFQTVRRNLSVIFYTHQYQ